MFISLDGCISSFSIYIFCATHCNTLQHTATHCNTHCNTLQHTATHSKMKECFPKHTCQCTYTRVSNTITKRTATRCNTCMFAMHMCLLFAAHCDAQHHSAIHCNALQHTATHCNTLQHIATHCNTLQHTATHCNTLQHTA